MIHVTQHGAGPWLLSLWRLCSFETFLPGAPHQRGLLRMLMIYFSGKLWTGGQSPICLRIFQGKVLSAVSRINGLTCKGSHHFAATDWWEQAELGERNLKSFISIVTRRQGTAAWKASGLFFFVCLFFPVFLLYHVFLCISTARQTKSRHLLRHSLPIVIALPSARHLLRAAIKLNNLSVHESLL